jgi:hypothetical protein
MPRDAREFDREAPRSQDLHVPRPKWPIGCTGRRFPGIDHLDLGEAGEVPWAERQGWHHLNGSVPLGDRASVCGYAILPRENMGRSEMGIFAFLYLLYT